MQRLRWLRMIGDTIFALGAIAFVYFALKLMWRSRARKSATGEPIALPVDIPQNAVKAATRFRIILTVEYHHHHIKLNEIVAALEDLIGGD